MLLHKRSTQSSTEIWGHHTYFICARHVAAYDAGMTRSASPSSFYHEACLELAEALTRSATLRVNSVEGVVEWVEGSKGRDLVFEFSFLEIHNYHT